MIGAFRVNSFNRTDLGSPGVEDNIWDFFVELARMDGYDLYFSRGKLVYCPPENVIREAHYFDLQNTQSTTFQRGPLFPGEPRVTVKSWNSWWGQMVSNDRILDASSSTPPDNLPFIAHRTNVEIVRPDLSEEDAIRLAEDTLSKLSGDRVTVDFSTLGGVPILPRDFVSLRDILPTFDGEYIVASARYRFSPETGARQAIHAISVDADQSLPTLAWLSP